MKGLEILLSIVLLTGLVALGMAGCGSQSGPDDSAALELAVSGIAPGEVVAMETFPFTLKTLVTQGKIVYIGVGGVIDSVVNPDLEVKPGTRVQVTLVNGDGMPHDVSFPNFAMTSSPVLRMGDFTVLTFVVDSEKTGIFPYYCTVPGHRQAGQEGRLVIRDGAIAAASRVN